LFEALIQIKANTQ